MTIKFPGPTANPELSVAAKRTVAQSQSLPRVTQSESVPVPRRPVHPPALGEHVDK